MSRNSLGSIEPTSVKMLLLIDDLISYHPSDFGLSAVLAILGAASSSLTFEITLAHRQLDPGSSGDDGILENFSFESFDLTPYQQVWFFGFRSANDAVHADGPPDSLTTAELDILSQWMDDGGGVFAVGDHADLGEALCGEIPRVRSMRYWRLDEAPPIDGEDRHDTLVMGNDYVDGQGRQHGELYTFDDESDDQPMPLRLLTDGAGQPHFLLETPTGLAIDVFPDHPHEGEIVLPKSLDEQYDFGSGPRAEYPERDGQQPAPEIVAWARVHGHTDENDINKGAANDKEFGAVGAYDGHAAGVGRVVVDSTWHHWFDVNLIGRLGTLDSGDERKRDGFLDTTEGQVTLARIQQYFVNIALWLTPPTLKKDAAARLLWNELGSYPLAEIAASRRSDAQLGQAVIEAMASRRGFTAKQLSRDLSVDALGGIARSMMEERRARSRTRARLQQLPGSVKSLLD